MVLDGSQGIAGLGLVRLCVQDPKCWLASHVNMGTDISAGDVLWLWKGKEKSKEGTCLLSPPRSSVQHVGLVQKLSRDFGLS